MALEMAVVSPLRSASKTRNSLTDCSIDPPLIVGDDGAAGFWLLPLPSLVPSMAGGLLGASFWEKVRWWPATGEPSEACDELGGELLAVLVAVLPAAGVDVPSVLDATLLSMCLTLCDLERLCLRGIKYQSQSHSQPDMCMPPHRRTARATGALTLPWLL